MSTAPVAVVLAAGKGTRMKSDLPKVLVPVCGRPMIRYVVDALHEAQVERIVVVVGHRADLVQAELADVPQIEFAEQTEQLGTGHAVMTCREQLAAHAGPTVIVTGDSPLLQSTSVAALVDHYRQQQPACALGVVHAADPTGLGRIVRDDAGEFIGIVEEKDATDGQRAIQEVNASTYLFDTPRLLWALDQLTNQNAQNEYYVTDCPAILLAAGDPVHALNVLKPCEALSINSVDDLRMVEAELERLTAAS